MYHLFTLLVIQLPVDCRLSVVKFWGRQKLYIDFGESLGESKVRREKKKLYMDFGGSLEESKVIHGVLTMWRFDAPNL